MFSGLTRSERRVLLSLVFIIGIGLTVNQIRQSGARREFQLTDGRKPRELTHSPPSPQEETPRAIPGEAEKINVNTALSTELQRLDGIGAQKAQAIIDERTANGLFRSVEDLDRVKGIGAATVEKLRPYVTIGPAGTPAPAPAPPALASGNGPGGPPLGSPGSPPDPAAPQIPSAPPAPLGPQSIPLQIATGTNSSAPGTVPPPPLATAFSQGVPPPTVGGGSRVEELININTAGVEELKRLHDVGDVLAKRILEYRAAHGPFRRPEDLMKVKGIGTKTLEKNRQLIRVE